MALPQITSIAEYNARNPCCCPSPDCPSPLVDFQVRAVKYCRPGAAPYEKGYPYEIGGTITNPAAFDYRTFGTLVPRYKHEKHTTKNVRTGRRVTKAKHYGGDPLAVDDTFIHTSVLRYIVSEWIEEEYGKAREDWPGSTNYPNGECPPEDTVNSAPAPAGLAFATIAAGGEDDNSSETTTACLLTWTNNRPEVTYPTGGGELGEDPLTVKVGAYEIVVDGSSVAFDIPPSEIDNPDFTGTRVLLANDDDTEHYFQVRHGVGSGWGPWSAPHTFHLAAPGCVPTVYSCFGSYLFEHSTGAPQRSVPPSVYMKAETWTASSGSGTTGGCAEDPVVYPSGFVAEVDTIGPVISPAIPGLVLTETVLPHKRTRMYVGSYGGVPDTEHPGTPEDAEADDPPPTPPAEPDETDPETPTPGWVITVDRNIAASTGIDIVLFSNDQNAGDTTLTALYTAALAIQTGWDALFGWGLYSNYQTLAYLVTGPPQYPNSVRCFGNYPITDGSSGGRELDVTLAKGRYRWYVSPEHAGATYSVNWEIGRFDDRWVKWAENYYTWAVAKYDFLNRPEEGDPDYPVIGDFTDDPETSEVNEAADALAAAIAALPQDPGTAPVEPETLRPVVVESPAPWVWAVEQASAEPEAVSVCDPTYASRVLVEPVEPLAADYGDPDDFADAHEAWEDAHDDWEAAVAAALAKSKRVSPWYYIVPTRVSDQQYIPFTVAALPAEPPPTANAIAAHARAVATYNWRLARYNDPARAHECFRICNVRYICGQSPYGTITNYDTGFPVTELPPLDPTTANPRRWADWYSFS